MSTVIICLCVSENKLDWEKQLRIKNRIRLYAEERTNDRKLAGPACARRGERCVESSSAQGRASNPVRAAT